MIILSVASSWPIPNLVGDLGCNVVKNTLEIAEKPRKTILRR